MTWSRGHASGEHAELVNGLRIPLGQRLTGWVGANRQTILNSDPVLDLGDMARSLNPSTPELSQYSTGRRQGVGGCLEPLLHLT